ncbi:MAG: hypothetical protein JJ863_37940 [Deltaproteobacteria bacterium]|nr:hypothetical protein [Deltaproteobacteria bacterium]
MRTVGISMVVLALTGCAGWEELPEGATGFLTLNDARLDGTLGGVSVSGDADATGYCTPQGWMVDLRATGPDGAVMSTMDIRGLFWTREDLTAVFRSRGADMELESSTGFVTGSWSGASEASAVVEGCAGPADEVWTTDESAEIAIVDVQFLEWDLMEVTYEASFASGDVLQGSFNSRMPTTD